MAGVPQPQGSKTHVGGGVMLEGRTPKAREAFASWREHVGWQAKIALEGCRDWTQNAPAYEMSLWFYFRPSRTRGRGFTGFALHDDKPDLDKLIRAVLDALTGIVYVDDKRVARFGDVGKFWTASGPVGAEIDVRAAVGNVLPKVFHAHKATARP